MAGFGKDSRFGFSAGARAGALYGQSEEIVYRSPQSPDYYSQLLWDIKPMVYAGADLSFTVNEFRNVPGFYTNLSFKAGIPLRSGIMEDRDWMNPLDYSILTNYSASNNYITRAFLADLALGVSIPLKYRDRIFAFLKLGGAVSYMYFDWIARDGYTQYDRAGGWDPADPKDPLYGDQVEYYQHWLAVSPGIAVTVPIRSRWLIEFSLNVVPGLIWCWALDQHLGYERYLQNHPMEDQNHPTEFQDRPVGGILLEPGLEVSYAFNERLALAGAVSYRHIQNSRGDNRDRRIGGAYSPWIPNTAGAAFRAMDVGLTLKVFF
ncbi:MAG: omptin family outer membrane protease [Treponema sp.]|jgi:outer membrane protease|nr:omptin family outer membrane protease [Treponema sp.]